MATVKIWDAETDIVHDVNESYDSDFWWEEGNGSCDCNRLLLCGFDDDSNYCLGAKRFVIVEIDVADIDLVNQDYDPVLVAKAKLSYKNRKESKVNQ